jgi:hypothetical protein
VILSKKLVPVLKVIVELSEKSTHICGLKLEGLNGVGLGVCVNVTDGVGLGVAVDVCVGVGVGVTCVDVGVGDDVIVGVDVCDGVCVGVGQTAGYEIYAVAVPTPPEKLTEPVPGKYSPTIIFVVKFPYAVSPVIEEPENKGL